MDRYLEFAANHTLLVAALLFSFFLLVFTELKRKASGAVNVEPQDAVRLINNDAIVLDLRSPEAFAKGHIVNAKNIPLDYPIKVAGIEVNSLTMRRPKARDQIAMERGGKSAAAQEVQLFADLCGVTADEIGEIDMTDYRKLQTGYEGFLSPASKLAPSGD
jgi:rhodanese-related sulfurtransferase